MVLKFDTAPTHEHSSFTIVSGRISKASGKGALSYPINIA